MTQSFADEFFRKLVDELPRVEVARIRVQNLTGGRCGTEPPEPGLHLYEEEGITGLEFPAGGRFVDILALDAQDNYVAIELKVSRGYDRVVGQLLRYIAWIRENQAEVPQTVRGMIVASEISEDLGLACSGLPDVKLFEYELSVAVRPVK